MKLRSPRSEQGFVLPVVLGVGLIMTLLGVIMINQSMQNRITAIAQKESSQSSGAAEAGLAQFQSLLYRYPRLGTYCSQKTLPDCNPNQDWQNITDADISTKRCTIATTNAPQQIQDYADDFQNNEWQNIGPDPSEGQFRLIQYTYKPSPDANTSPKGELLLEGRINGSDPLRLSTTQLKVQFEFRNGPSIGNPPGLWIQSNKLSNLSANAQLKADVRDSTCPDDAGKVLRLKNRLQPPYTYQQEAGVNFPQIPSKEESLALLGADTPKTIPAIDLQNRKTETLPKAGDTNAKGVAAYSVGANRKTSLVIEKNSVLNIGTGAKETVVLYLEGGIEVKDNSRIKVAEGSKLIIYADGGIDLSGESNLPLIEQAPRSDSPTNVQIFVYPPKKSEPAHEVMIEGGTQMSLFLLAPASEVNLDTDARVKGTIWANYWEGWDDSIFEEGQTDLSEVKLLYPPRMSPLTAWERIR